MFQGSKRRVAEDFGKAVVALSGLYSFCFPFVMKLFIDALDIHELEAAELLWKVKTKYGSLRVE